jgi:hypothetical protein
MFFPILVYCTKKNLATLVCIILSIRNRHFFAKQIAENNAKNFLTLSSGLKAARKALTHELRHTVSRPGLLSQGSFCKQTLEHNCGRQRQEPVQRPPPLQQQHWRFSRLDCYVKV